MTPACLSAYLPAWLYACLHACLRPACLCLSACRHACLHVCLCLFVCLTACLSICVFLCVCFSPFSLILTISLYRAGQYFSHPVFSVLCHVFRQLLFIHVSLYVVPPSLSWSASVPPPEESQRFCTDVVGFSPQAVAKPH